MQHLVRDRGTTEEIGLQVKLVKHRQQKMGLRNYEISNYVLLLVMLVSSSNGSEVIDVGGKTLSRGTRRGMAYANFKAHKFSFLNITNIGSDYVLEGSECGFACVNIPSCFSFNLAAVSDIMNGKILCELLPSDIYNNSKKFIASQFHHHYSITSPCTSWPCQNNGKCAAQYEKNSYVCVCAKGYTGKYCETAVKNCDELYKSGKRNSGVYTINPDGLGAFDVFCDQTTSGGGWTVFQKRMDGSVDFYRGWAEYKRGFGNLNGEFWLGLDRIQRMTSSGGYKLRVDLEDFAGNTVYAEYALFAVGSGGTKYQLTAENYSGTAGDSLAYHNGYPFSTKDQDNDSGSNFDCAVRWKGAWWYNDCHHSNLNGIYHHGYHTGSDGVRWYYWKQDSAKRAEMKIRPVNY